MKAGGIVAIVLGSLAVLAMLFFVIYFFILRERIFKKQIREIDRRVQFLHALLIGQDAQYVKRLENLDEYNVIYLGYPTWWRTYPRVVATFVRDNVFVGKTIYPFCTNEEGSMGLSELELKGAAKGAVVRNGFACKGSEVNDIDEKLKDWLKR